MKVLRTNAKAQIAILLFVFYLITLSHLPFNQAIALLLLCVGGTVLTDLLFGYIRVRKFFIPYAGIVTGLILTLIIDTGAAWYQILFIATAAMGIKNFLRISGRHVFNPAASGLLAGWFAFGLSPSWWGASPFSGSALTLPNILIYAGVLSFAFVSCFRLKRYYAILAFLLLSAIGAEFMAQTFSLQSLLASITSIGTLFYALVMLPEPMTSPVKKERQLMYAGLVAIVSTLLVFVVTPFLSQRGIALPNSSIIALLIGNLLFFKFR
ncbi:MAG: RnfABCDGE type electron transport complex subunit D [Candidatus Levybacteria bacterium]|nr:RnfABCDGE type electron transport complex subunit D [Candidatus Levybacteria bacterium]